MFSRLDLFAGQPGRTDFDHLLGHVVAEDVQRDLEQLRRQLFDDGVDGEAVAVVQQALQVSRALLLVPVFARLHQRLRAHRVVVVAGPLARAVVASVVPLAVLSVAVHVQLAPHRVVPRPSCCLLLLGPVLIG